jgi:hypothetical protein
MPIEIYWEIPQRVLYLRYSGHMTVQDIRDSIDQMREHFEDGLPLVHVILDIGEVTGYPNLAELRHGLNYERSPKQGWTMFVGAEGIARFISSVLAQLAGNRFRMFDKAEHAMIFLNEMDETLQEQPASQSKS